jgi:copper resistance protein B
MKNNTFKPTAIVYAISLAIGILSSSFAQASSKDDPILTKFMLDKFEVRNADGSNPLIWEGEAWIGQDLNKLWLKSEGERVDGKIEESETELLYSRAIAPFWDAQVGIRHDEVEDESRDYATIAIKGLAPYYFETDASVSFGKNGQTKINASAEYELMFTQKLVLSPEIEFNAYGKDDIAMGVGSGLSNIEAGLRLRYEIKREFAPYIGVNWNKKFGKTADIAIGQGADGSDTQRVAGISAWF